MRIVITHTEAALAQSWQQAVSARLPQATVFIDDPAQATASIAIGWSPGAEFFTHHRGLRAFFSAAAGVEHVLHNPGLPLNMPVVRLEDAGMSLQMVEYCLHEVLRLRGRHNNYEQQHRDKVWRELVPLDRRKLRIGVFGVGVLGAPVARAFAQLGYPVTGYARTEKSLPGVDVLHGVGALEPFLARSDVLILMAPLTAATQWFLNQSTVAQLPRGAYLINVARGTLVDDNAVLQALDSGQLSGASLDVFATEPLPTDHRYWSHQKVRITPHVSAITEVEPSADQVVAKITAWAAGDAISGIVDPARGY